MAASEFEVRLERALAPVEPPEALVHRLEGTLGTVLDLAAEELEAWELASMRDPRNWHRPVVAGTLGGVAAVGLVLIRTRHKQPKRRAQANDPLDWAERTLKDLRAEAKKVVRQLPER